MDAANPPENSHGPISDGGMDPRDRKPTSAYDDIQHWRDIYGKTDQMHNDLYQVLDRVMEEANTAEARLSTLQRFAQHLVSEAIERRCALVGEGDKNSSQCPTKAVAIRWEDGFADSVCQTHADAATQRGALVIHARRHDGTGQWTTLTDTARTPNVAPSTVYELSNGRPTSQHRMRLFTSLEGAVSAAETEHATYLAMDEDPDVESVYGEIIWHIDPPRTDLPTMPVLCGHYSNQSLFIIQPIQVLP